MDKTDKLKLSETDICDLFITPAIKTAKWDPLTQIRREVTLTPGPVIVRGNLSSRNKKKKKFADYILSWKPSLPIAVVEAKENNLSISHGLQQALGYADILQLPSAFSSNGDGFASHNKSAGPTEDIETEFALENFPSPEVLWKRYKTFHAIKDQEVELVEQPYHVDSDGKEPRYYQVEAINRTVEAVARGQKRVLLVMATGTGKTYTTFQIIWRLWKAGEAKRILYLADRNILLDQTLVNDFKPFGAVMTKVKNRNVDPAYEVHLALYQALTGPDESDKIFKSVSRDFFDLIVVDECHRGSAAEDSACLCRSSLGSISYSVGSGATLHSPSIMGSGAGMARGCSLTGVLVPTNKAIVGSGLYQIESGIIASWFKNCGEKNATELFPIRWSAVGQPPAEVVMGKGSGIDSINMWLKDVGMQVSEEDAMKALQAVKLHSLTNKKMLSHAEFRDVARATLGRTQAAAE